MEKEEIEDGPATGRQPARYGSGRLDEGLREGLNRLLQMTDDDIGGGRWTIGESGAAVRSGRWQFGRNRHTLGGEMR